MSEAAPSDLAPDIAALERLADSLTDEQTHAVEQLAAACLRGDVTLGTLKGYSSDDIEAMYCVAYELYGQQKYDSAAKLFELLILYEGPVARFWLGLAGCHQRRGDYEKAITAYSLVALFDSTNPKGSFHACECFIAMRQWENARLALDAVRGVCEMAPDESRERAEFLTRVEALHDVIAAAGH